MSGKGWGERDSRDIRDGRDVCRKTRAVNLRAVRVALSRRSRLSRPSRTLGIAEVQRRLKENGNPQAEFDISLVTAFKVSVMKRVDDSLDRSTQNGKESTSTSVESTEKSTEVSTETEVKIMAMMRENKSITQSAIAERLGVTRNYVAKLTMALTARKLIRRVGSDRGGTWEVVD